MSMFGSEWGSGGLFGSSPPPGAPDFSPRFLDAKKAPPADRPSLTRSGGPPRRRVSARPAGQSASPVAKKPHLDAYPDDFTGGGPAPSLPDDPAEWDTYTDSKKRRIKRNNRAPSLIDDFDDFDDRMYARKPDRPKNTPDDGFDDDLDSGDIPGISAFSGGHHHSHDDEDSPRDGERDGDRDHTVPRIFSDYFGGDYAKQRAAHKNQRDSAKARTRRRVRNALLITLGVAAVSAAAIFCIKTFVVFKPFDLSAPFGQVDDEAVFTLIEPAVTQVMRGRRFSLSVENGTVKQDVSKTDAPKTEVPKTDAPKTDAPKTDAPKTDVSKTDAPKEEASKTDVSQADASQSNISPSDVSPSDVSGSDADDGGGFVLAEFGFSLADADAPDRQIIDITDDKGKVTETHVLVRRGSIIYNETLVKRFLDRVAEENEGVPMIESRHEISGEELTVYEGKEGYGIDYDTFVSRLFSAIKSKSTAVSVRMEDLTPPAVSAAALYADVHREVSDASKVEYPDGSAKYTPDVVGIDFDMEQAGEILSNGKAPWKIPLTVTQPALTLKLLRADECPDLLAEYSTKFDVTNTNRSHNLTMAAELISGTVLKSGEQISFNDTVGERTPERGFEKAPTYSESGVQEDYGGGICQVSSTLHYTFVMANLKVVERRCHKYTVNYMKYGTDATVDWGHIDLKLENDKEFPIKVEFFVNDGVITCRVWGTDDGYTAILGYNEVKDSVKFTKVEYARQKSPPEKNVKGHMGLSVNVYRIVYKDGEEVSRKFVYRDTYQPLNDIHYVSERDLPKGAKFRDDKN